jgi:hypothetical protein
VAIVDKISAMVEIDVVVIGVAEINVVEIDVAEIDIVEEAYDRSSFTCSIA